MISIIVTSSDTILFLFSKNLIGICRTKHDIMPKQEEGKVRVCAAHLLVNENKTKFFTFDTKWMTNFAPVAE